MERTAIYKIMLKAIVLVVAIGSFLPGAHAQTGDTISIKGVFFGKNIYIQNPYGSSGIGFCVHELFVNGKRFTDQCFRGSPFELDLACCGVSRGDSISIDIIPKKGCEPNVLNPEVLKPQSTYELVSIDMNKDSLSWKTKGESGSLPFYIEQFRWNRWVRVGEVKGIGNSGENAYTFKIATLHSGENIFRVQQENGSNTSKPVVYKSDVAAVTFEPKRVEDFITFSATTMYEIYDSLGQLVKKGAGERVNCATLKKGEYILNYDNQQEKFVKSKK